MTHYDTFETESPSAYSGSYNSRVMYGSFFWPGTSYDRILIADKVSGVVSRSFFDERNVYQQSFGMYVQSGSYIGRNTRIMPLMADGEIYHDSLTISPLLYTKVNGGTPIGYSGPLSGSVYFNIPASAESGSANIHIATSGAAKTAGATTYTDGLWVYAFPFESRYKTLPRTLLASYGISPVTTDVSSSDVYGSLTGVAKTTFRNVTQILTIKMSPDFANSSMSSQASVYDGIYVSGSGRFQYAPNVIPEDMGVRDPFLRPSLESINKCYFGVGHGRHGLVTSGHYKITAFSLFGILVAPLLHGWKYGIYNGNPVTSKAIFRVGHFGFLRDMLEQRPFTKFFDQNAGTVDTAIHVSAVSGTQLYAQTLDYVTATNPSYNPRDSGAWDYEYRSGQPFSDI